MPERDGARRSIACSGHFPDYLKRIGVLGEPSSDWHDSPGFSDALGRIHSQAPQAQHTVRLVGYQSPNRTDLIDLNGTIVAPRPNRSRRQGSCVGGARKILFSRSSQRRHEGNPESGEAPEEHCLTRGSVDRPHGHESDGERRQDPRRPRVVSFAFVLAIGVGLGVTGAAHVLRARGKLSEQA